MHLLARKPLYVLINVISSETMLWKVYLSAKAAWTHKRHVEETQYSTGAVTYRAQI